MIPPFIPTPGNDHGQSLIWYVEAKVAKEHDQDVLIDSHQKTNYLTYCAETRANCRICYEMKRREREVGERYWQRRVENDDDMGHAKMPAVIDWSAWDAREQERAPMVRWWNDQSWYLMKRDFCYYCCYGGR